MPVAHGAVDLSAIALGSTKLSKVMYGGIKVYDGSPVDTDFNLLGVLYDWFIDFAGDIVASVTGFGGLVGQLISDGVGGIFNGLGVLQGTLAKFVPVIDTSSGNLGIIVSQIPGAVATGICTGLNAVGGLVKNLANGGLIGFINGLPIIGGAFAWLEEFFTGGDPLGSITSLIGAIPVVQDLANLLGILQNATTGFLNDPVNFILNNVGTVIGQLSCGLFTPAGSDDGQDITYPIGSIGNMGRLLVPDGLVALNPITTFARSEGQTADDGWLEIGVAAPGNAGYSTRVFRRYDNSGAKASGVGLHLMDGQVSIVRRVAKTDTIVTPSMGPYIPGDVFRLVQTDDLHEVFRNGSKIGEWDDTGHTGAIGAANRAVGMAMQASQDLAGPRSFSPALRYIRAA